ncbi:transcriptional-regulating factor 1-like isoform X2 [Salarias fasciatus]|uniref:transcriptional-regulating factor 1-like isoform X2 n=1 Tax=Salarias fasciatus TaxID=181472 RepID=UPI001176CDAC|nr:transcriptional-regulating factor 1-like isoform X2 [Salarias fasciatus]
MSDAYSTFSPPPTMHHSYQAPPPPYIHSPPQTSPHFPPHFLPQMTPPHLPHPQMTPPHLSHRQMTPPHLPHPQMTPPHLPHRQMTPPHLPHPQMTPPHLPHPQMTPPHLLPPHSTSSHVIQTHVAPHHLPPGQVTSSHLPHPQGTPLHLVHQSQETLFDFPYAEVSPSQVPPLPQDLLFGSNPSSDFDQPDWDGPGLSCLLSGEGFPSQNQASVLHDGNVQLANSTHTLLEQGHLPGHTWGPLELAQPQLHCSAPGSVSERGLLGGWSSMDDLPDVQFFNDAPQPFYSPATPGPSPQYPSTPALLGTGPQRAKGPVFNSQQSFSCSLTESHQQLLHQMSSLPIQPEPDDRPPGLPGSPGLFREAFSGQGRELRLNQRKECREGTEPDSRWMKLMKPESSAEVPDSRLLCLVCQREFRSLPALNGHMRSHSGVREASWVKKDPSTSSKCTVSMVMPVTVPVQSRGASKAWRRGQRRCRSAGGGSLYCSLMRPNEKEEEEGEGEGEEGAHGDGGHYVPPLMLPPLRAGPGLFCTLTTGRQKRVQTVQFHNGSGGVGVESARPPPGTLTARVMKPRINVGSGFQANIPPLQPKKRACLDSHNALLQWAPWTELEQPATRQRVEALLRMVRSSVVAGGGASPDHTLHVLSQCKGDFLRTTEKLLSSQTASSQAPAGVRWSPAEKRLLVKSLQLHQKNFHMVQKAVKTKSLSECVEFYYLFKKKMSLSSSLTVTLPDADVRNKSVLRVVT